MIVKVTCDNRLRMARDGEGAAPAALVELLREWLTFKNPAWSKLKAMGVKYISDKEPQFYEMLRFDLATHEDPVHRVSIPRGCMNLLRAAIDDLGLDYEVEDRRSVGNAAVTGSYLDPWELQAGVKFPEYKLVPWDHQRGIIDAIVKYEQALVHAPTGCITGDAMIGINRAGKGSQMRLDHVVKCFNGGASGGRVWDKAIPTLVRARRDDGTVGLVQLREAYESGVKEVFDLVLSSGHVVRATKDHRIFTEYGWKRLEALMPGDLVHVESHRRPMKLGVRKKPWYRLRVAPHHPYVGRQGVKPNKGGFTVPEHRLVAEARLNGISLDELITRCRSGEIEGLKFLDPVEWAVHHKDEDSHNNSPDNLQVCTHEEHRQLHRDLAIENIAVRTELTMVESIVPRGMQMTYDLALDAPHNFIANGVVVHNSGKTSALIAAIAQLGVPALVIMWDTGLLKQWSERIEAELGIKPRDQGLIQGKTCRLKGITLAMQQTLNRWDDKRWRQLDGVFGLVACDEVQRYAANTFVQTIDRFDAKYRVGVSADSRRKDGKHFLVHCMFGPPRHEVDKKQLIDKRIIHDVEVFVVPTDFRADWYVERREKPDQKPNPQDFNRLLDEMQADAQRNELAVHLIAQCVRAGLPTLSFTHRVDHAKLVDSMATARALRSGLALGGEDWRDQFNATVQGLRDGSCDVGCGTFQKLGVGHDIPTVAAGITVTPVHNNRQFMDQVKGRICRTSSGKENARILVLWDRHVFGDYPLYNLKRWNETVRVWCTHDKRWKTIDQYMKELKDGRAWASDAPQVDAGVGDIFGSAQR